MALPTNWQLTSPITPEHWQAYYQLRWQVLRAPWQQPLGSEQDEFEAQAHHLMLTDGSGLVQAVGRLHRLDDSTGQIRYMAVADSARKKGAGSMILHALEQQAVYLGLQQLQLNAREDAVGFYQQLGYKQAGDAAPLFGIAHLKMIKALCLTGSADDFKQWQQQLAQTWRQTIPLSQYMQINISGFNGYRLSCSAPLAPNINLHQTMFAGSIYTLATLTGWGMLYMQLQALGLQGAQVLAHADIRYLRPVDSAPEARCQLLDCIGDLGPLVQGKKVRQRIKVGIYCQQQVCAEFIGQYVVLPEPALQN
ncbi:thioesterase domain-containing protein, putative [Arsukibacterium tuosuense]|uniref:Thioesterase domain-containing protein, putative n=1 Tax=Arsukibacterium tuosuense TaxID=1323745 RepID=A0A285JB56_9GAMM|nr:bifunctional GNAT family N-acetyltransferase/hotdog fold thioesterase [Arsukibacterium tuosuense]SNY57499.1 thioesterase domain-containing protein, putative [Arsukibacterium tuosuense]